MKPRSVFFISDSTGITAKTLGQSLLSQFEDIPFHKVMLPYIDSEERARAVVDQIKAAYEADGAKPIIFDTVINQKIRAIITNSPGFMVDIFSTFLSPLEKELQSQSSYSVGKSHQIGADESQYSDRINAVHFAMDNDDGTTTSHYKDADIILVGVSRSGKTPTCLYLALNFGIYAANYPFTEEDFEQHRLPDSLLKFRDKLFGLTIDPDRLAAIRNERKAGSRYASPQQCEFEVREVEGLYQRYNIPFVDATRFSIEEIATKIVAETGLANRNR